jgi:transposase-like protein
MDCVCCGSAAVTERPERTAQGYRRFRCRDCAKQFNERSAGVLNRTQYPSDIIALVVLWRLRYRLTQHVPADRRRRLHLRRATAALAILGAA